MEILYLGTYTKLVDFLRIDRNIDVRSEPYNEATFPKKTYDCIISYGYRHKIPQSAIDDVRGCAINLHISYLPYNRGANPNYWSWVDRTPKGVTIHYIDENFDTGDIIVQKEVGFSGVHPLTLATTYQKLKEEIEDLFIQNWAGIFFLSRHKQIGKGTSHTTKDPMSKLTNGYDTECSELWWD
jgi:methionyl-tRNA formyltransferase